MLKRRHLIQGGLAATLATPAWGQEADPLTRILASGKVLQRFGPGRDDAVAAFEQRYKTRFSPAYRAFLRRENGLRFIFSSEEAERAGVSGALADMNTFFGIGNGDPDNDLLLLTGHVSWWHSRLLPFAPVVGLGGDFCTYAEINGGKYDGHIFYTDGELFPSFRNAPLDKPVDDLVDGFVAQEWFMPVAPSFDALLADYARMA